MSLEVKPGARGTFGSQKSNPEREDGEEPENQGKRALLWGLLGAAAVAGCTPLEQEAPPVQVGGPLSELLVRKVTEDLSTPDPGAAFWASVPFGTISLMAQPMVTPRPESTTTESLAVQAVHDGTHVAFRLKWKDAELSEAGILGRFSDAAAIQFPMLEGDPPAVMMGERDKPVHIFHWRAQYQRDAERGKPTMKDLYPNLSVDMYPMDFKEAKGGTEKDKEKFNPGVAVGNPQSYAKAGVDEIVAEGFSTSAVQEGHGSAARGAWQNGEWTLVVVRKLAVEGGSTLKPGGKSHVAFAVWQGGKGEVGSRKCVTMQWTPMVIQ